MDFSTIFQLRDKKFWWVDVIYYFAISLVLATVFCYVIFLTKNIILNTQIKNETTALQTVGTDEQKNYETQVLLYQKKIRDFNTLFKNHEFASNVFAFLGQTTRPNIWFLQFSLDEKNNSIQLSGQADNMEAFSRQVADFEGNKYVKTVGPINTSLAQAGKINFSISVSLDQKIFSYLADLSLQPQAAAAAAAQPTTTETAQAPAAATNNKSNGKLITLFNLPLNPQVVGQIDQTQHTVTLNVPYGTDLTRLIPSINISPQATIIPVIGSPQDFTNSVVYTITAQDGTSQNYTVFVNVLPKQTKNSGFSIANFIIFIVILTVVVAIIAVTILIILRRTQKK